jgi:transcriptional regulator of heat shock response
LKYLKESFAEQAQFDIPDQLCPSDVSEFSDYIDAKIETKNFCIIIENKINNAVDQDRQIERYVDKVKPHNNNIFVLYLTLDGNKDASHDSIGKINVPIIMEAPVVVQLIGKGITV